MLCLCHSKPQLTTIPFPLKGINSPRGTACMVKLFMEAGKPDNNSCMDLNSYIHKFLWNLSFLLSQRQGVTVYCLIQYSTSGKYVGEISTCNVTENITTDGVMSNLADWLSSGDFRKIRRPRADIWWLCGGMTLWPILPANWTGLCALVHLRMLFTLIQHHDMKLTKREKRSTPSGGFDDRVCINNIVVPRGGRWDQSYKLDPGRIRVKYFFGGPLSMRTWIGSIISIKIHSASPIKSDI